MKKKKKEKVIKKSGTSIELSMEGDENLEILAGWWRVLHQFTDHLMMGKFTAPITARIEAYLSALDLSSYELLIIISPK